MARVKLETALSTEGAYFAPEFPAGWPVAGLSLQPGKDEYHCGPVNPGPARRPALGTSHTVRL